MKLSLGKNIWNFYAWTDESNAGSARVNRHDKASAQTVEPTRFDQERKAYAEAEVLRMALANKRGEQASNKEMVDDLANATLNGSLKGVVISKPSNKDYTQSVVRGYEAWREGSYVNFMKETFDAHPDNARPQSPVAVAGGHNPFDAVDFDALVVKVG